MKINNKCLLNDQNQLQKNTKDIEELKEKYKGEVYAALPYSEWPEDVVLEQVEDPRDFTYVPRAITNVPADAKYGYFLLNVEDFVDPSNSAALLFKIKSVNNSFVYIEFYANVASHVPGPQGETGPQGPQGIQGPQGEPGQTTIGIEVVAELPATGEEGVIYFVPKEDSETGDEYEEYTYVNDEWELLGSAQVDLTDYALKSEIPVIDEDLIPKAFNTYVLGDNTHSYKEVVANKFKSPNSYYEISGVNINGHGQVSIKTTDGNGTSEAQIQLGNTALYTNKNIAPLSGSTVNLGQASNGFNNLYLDGKIVTDDNLSYGLALPDTTSYTADKTIATTDDLPNYTITNAITETVGQDTYVDGIQVKNATNNITYNVYAANANPALSGNESDLTSIRIGSTDYNIPSGTNVIANPTLAGTETTLTGLQIDSTKYNLPYATIDQLYEQQDYGSILYAMNASQNDGNVSIIFDYNAGGTTYDMLIAPKGNDTGNYVIPLDMTADNAMNKIGEHFFLIPNKGIYAPDIYNIIDINNVGYAKATLIQSFKTEQWTFTLSDNTTVTKNILVA